MSFKTTNNEVSEQKSVIQIDKEFELLIDFLKQRDFLQIKNIILENFQYLKNTNLQKYILIVNYYNQYKHLWGGINVDTGNLELIENCAKMFVEHLQDFEWLYEQLNDYRSKRILLNILTYWLTVDDSKISQLNDKYFSQYFDYDIIKCNKNEIFVDVGAYIGDTLVEYVKAFGADCYNKFYCYEIVPKNIDLIKKNIELFNLKNVIIREKGVSDKNGFMYLTQNEISSIITLAKTGKFKVATVKLDDDISEKVTFIKMDIEGAEEQALKGCLKTIKKHKPKLALSVYHNYKDLWKLPRIISKTCNTYKYYLRYYGGNLIPTEFILYAI